MTRTLVSIRTQGVPRYKLLADPDAKYGIYRQFHDSDSISVEDSCMAVFRPRRRPPCR